jgi:hypothetical protein
MKKFVCKRKSRTSWPHRTGLEKISRRQVAHGENVDYICWHLYNSPGARYTEVTRALCARNGTEYHRGQYSNYFNRGYGNNGHVDKLWRRASSGWILTLDGMNRYGEWCA